MHKVLIPLLLCPICHGELRNQIVKEDTTRIVEGEFTCKECKRRYLIIDEIGFFLETKEAINDLWKKQEDFAMKFRKEHPILYFLLTKTFLGNIKPEHFFFKGLLLEDDRILKRATKRIYTRDYLIGYEKIKQALWEVENEKSPIILEIACGRGDFFKQFIQLRRGKGIYIAADFSLSVLRSDQRWLRKNNLDKQVTLIAFDAKAMPFRNNSIPAIVSTIGFPNIHNGGKAVYEAFRILTPNGILMTNFMFTTKQTKNYAKARELGLEQFYVKESTEEILRRAGFEFNLQELYHGSVRPTPGGIDSLPVVPDLYSFCFLKAKKPVG